MKKGLVVSLLLLILIVNGTLSYEEEEKGNNSSIKTKKEILTEEVGREEPFLPPVEILSVVSPSLPATFLRLSGIVEGIEGKIIILEGGEKDYIARVSDMVGDQKVIRIEKGEAVLVKEGKEEVFRLKGEHE